jgi:large subunit ribosomal protein L35
MPKLKTRKSVAKRFKITGTGKLKRRQQGLKHILEFRSAKSKRQATPDVIINDRDERRIRSLLPYSAK